MTTDDTDREEGVDFAEVSPALEELSYPITADELVEQHGDHELGRTNANPIPVRELLEYMGEDTFESPEALSTEESRRGCGVTRTLTGRRTVGVASTVRFRRRYGRVGPALDAR